MMTRPAFNIRFFTWVVQHPWLVIALTILWTGALGFHLKDMSFDPDSRVFFSATNPQRIALDKVENTYNKANNVLFVLAPKNGDVFTKRTLELVEELTDRAWRMPSSFRVDSIANFSHTYARGDDLIVEPLYKNASAMSDADIARTRGLTLGNKELVNRLISAKGDVTAVSVLVNMHDNGRVEVPKIALWSRELAKELGAKYPDVEFRLTGGVIADETFAEAGNRDLATLTPVMLLMIFVALWAGLRTFGGTVATMFVVVLSVVVALGIYVGTGTILNGATAGAPVIIMTVSILDSAHIIRATGQQLRTGLTKEQAIVKSLELNNMAIFVTSFTDVIGFMTLNFAESPPLIELGNIVTVGVVAAYILSMTFLPALLAILPAPPAEDRFGLDDKMARIARYIILHRRKFLVSTSVVVVLMSAGIYRITLDDDFIKYFSKSYDFRNDTEFLQERLGGLHVINFSIASGEEQGVTRPDYLATIDKFAAWYRQQPNVVHVASLADTMKRLNKNLNGDDPAQEKVPESRNLAAQMLLLYEMSLPFGHDLRGQLDVSRSSSLVTVWVRNVSSSDIKRLGLAGEEWLRKNAPNEMHSTATGLSMAYAYISERSE
ncbi:MAG: RND family transporter, partial [Alphaproteobacteria bacterium]